MVTIVSYVAMRIPYTKPKTKDVTFYYFRYGTLPASIAGHLRILYKKENSNIGTHGVRRQCHAIPAVE